MEVFSFMLVVATLFNREMIALTFEKRERVFMGKVKNRWLIAASAVGVHISIGSAYAWSVFTNPLVEKFGWSSSQVSFAFSIAIFMLGFSAAFMGRFVE